MDNTWYYTLSTIVQSLAAVFAISATFLVFKLQTLNQELRKYRNKAIRSMVYLDRLSETKYDSVGLVEVARRFHKRINKISSPYPTLGLDYEQFTALRELWSRLEEGLGYGAEKSFEEYFFALLKQNAEDFEYKVEYRIRLWLWALTSGLILTLVMILSLLTLSGTLHPINEFFFNLSARYILNFLTIFACIGIVSVMATAVYAIWGER